MAKVLVTLRLTGQVSNGVARGILAQLQSLTDACEVLGVEVKQSVDARFDPEQPGPKVDVVELVEDITADAVVEDEPDKPSKFKGAR
jgi:hypothetical protein